MTERRKIVQEEVSQFIRACTRGASNVDIADHFYALGRSEAFAASGAHQSVDAEIRLCRVNGNTDDGERCSHCAASGECVLNDACGYQTWGEPPRTSEEVAGIERPADFTFAKINEYVHAAGRQYEELQCLALTMARQMDSRQAVIAKLEKDLSDATLARRKAQAELQHVISAMNNRATSAIKDAYRRGVDAGVAGKSEKGLDTQKDM